MHGTSGLGLSAIVLSLFVGIAYWRSGIVEWNLRRKRPWARCSICPKPPHCDSSLEVDSSSNVFVIFYLQSLLRNDAVL